MKIRLIWVGKTQEAWIKEGIAEYAGRIRRYSPFEISEVKEGEVTTLEKLRQSEADKILKLLPKNCRLVLLDENGEGHSSETFAKLIERERDNATNELVFAIGGAYGFGDSLKKWADTIITLSQMTFTHQMVRVIFLEQLYRAFTIINKESYHH
jgi:23S rRNA (pseudouridine1915-N3)-methyltransferase